MRNGRAEGAGLGPLDVDVDPLVVAGGFGKLVHLLLGDGDPVAGGYVLADEAGQFGQGFDGSHATQCSNSGALDSRLRANDVAVSCPASAGCLPTAPGRVPPCSVPRPTRSARGRPGARSSASAAAGPAPA